MAVHEPPLGLPFVDDRFYVARPWIEWLILARENFVDIEENVGEGVAEKVATNIINIAINAANIAINTANIATNTANITTNTANILSNEALSYYFASL